MKEKTTPAKGTTPKASAKPDKFAPITIKLTAEDSTATWDLQALPALRLKELLRERGIFIPKRKEDMVGRLIDWAASGKRQVTVTIA